MEKGMTYRRTDSFEDSRDIDTLLTHRKFRNDVGLDENFNAGPKFSMKASFRL